MATGTELLIAPYGQNSQKQANRPNPTQQRVLDWIDNIRANPDDFKDHIPVLYIQGGVGSGKSRAILAPIIELLLEIPGLRVLWGRSDFKDIKLSIMDKFFEIMPPELIVSKSEQYHWYNIAQNGGGRSRIYFNGLKDLSGLGSQEFGVIAVTEAYELTEQAYRTLKRRCRQENVINIILLEGEAPNEDHWLARLTDPDDPSYDSDIEQWRVSTYENWDNLPTAYTGSLEGMPESWKKKYLLGQYGFIPDGDPFYQGFKEALHKREIKPTSAKPLLLGWDYGYRHPACVVSQIDAKGRWGILREIIGTNIIVKNFGAYVTEYLNIHFPGYSYTSTGYGDPAGEQAGDKSEETSVEILKSQGFHIASMVSTYRDRKEIIERLLGTLIEGIPALIVDPACKTIIDGFLGGYHYPIVKQGQSFTTIKTEMPHKDGYYEHPMNALEYIAVNVYKPVPRAKSAANRTYLIRELKDRRKNSMNFKGKRR